MIKKMEEILKALKEVDKNDDHYIITKDDEGGQCFQYQNIVNISTINIDENNENSVISVAFLSCCPPDVAANITLSLYKKGLDFKLCANVYPSLEYGKLKVLYAEEADSKFHSDIYERIKAEEIENKEPRWIH